MTKLVSLRVIVPTDDDVTTEEVQSALRSILDVLPIGRAGEDKTGGRMHWTAVDVLRGADRTAAPMAPRRAKKVA